MSRFEAPSSQPPIMGLPADSKPRRLWRFLYISVRKSQTLFGQFQAVVALLAWLSVIIMVQTTNERYVCTPKSTANATEEEQPGPLCTEWYTTQVFSPSFHRNFALVNIGMLVLIWVIYALYVLPRLLRILDGRTHHTANETWYLVSLHSAYFWQVFTRLCLFIVSLCVLFYYQPLSLPLSFECVKEKNGDHLRCRDGSRTQKVVAFILSLTTNVASLFFTFVETVWVLSLIRIRHSSVYPDDLEEGMEGTCWCICSTPIDQRFAVVYLKIVPRQVNVLQCYFEDAFQRILHQTEHIEGLSPSDELKLDDLFTEPVLRESIADPPNVGLFDTRWSLDTFESQDQQTSKRLIHSIDDIFFPVGEMDTVKECRPRRILITGDTGMGKSVVAIKLARNIALAEEGQRLFKMAFLVDMNLFPATQNICIRKLFSRSCFGTEMPDEVLEYMATHPEEVLIMIDNAKEVQPSKITGPVMDTILHWDKKLPVSSVCAKLLSGEIMNGATVIMIARSEEGTKGIAFDRKIEVMGFTMEKIQHYASNFFEDCSPAVRDAGMACLTEGSTLALCCVPGNCMLMCSYLKQQSQVDSTVIPTNLTELYTGVLKILLNSLPTGAIPGSSGVLSRTNVQCSPEARNNSSSSSSIRLRSCHESSPEIFNDQQTRLLERASQASFDSIHTNFELSKEDCLELEKAGILHRPSDSQSIFCFRQQTLSVFLAARHVVYNCTEEKLKRVIHAKGKFADGNWDQVRFFACGLLGGESPQRHREIMESLAENLNQEKSKGQMSKGYILRTIKCVAEFRDPALIRDTATKLIPNLDLRGLGMTAIDVSAVVDVLCHASYRSLLNLDVSHNDIGAIGALRIAELLEKGTGPTEALQLNGNWIGSSGMRRVFLAIGRSGYSPKSLQAARNCIDGATMEALASAITRSPSCGLEEVDLSSNALDTQGAKFLADVLQDRDCKVQSLDLSFNCIGDEGARDVAQANACSTRSSGCMRLRQLNLGWNGISSRGMEDLTTALGLDRSRAPRHIDLSGSTLDQSAVNSLAQLIELADGSIKSMGLNSSQLGDEAVDRLSVALESTYTEVTQLSLGQNLISPVGAERFAKALCQPSCSCITVLNLGGNELQDKGADSLAAVLSQPSCNVETLDMSRNDIGERGAGSIAQALRKRNCVKNLNLHGNKIYSQGAQQLFGAIRVEKCKLVRLFVGANAIDISGIAKLPHTFRSPHCKLELLDISENSISAELFLDEFTPQFEELSTGSWTLVENRNTLVFQVNGRKRKIKFEAWRGATAT